MSPDPPAGKPAPTGAATPALARSYPWAREREALAALGRLDLEEARRALVALGTELEASPGAALGPSALLLAELLSRLRATLGPESDGGGGPASEEARAERAERLGGAPNLAALRAGFLLEVEFLFRRLASGSGQSPGVVRARAHLDLHFRRRIGLREVAKAVSLSPNYLSSLFRKETGATVTGYVRLRRMRLAEQLLLEGKRTISEVAYLVGYQNYRDFHRNFVRHAGRSPREFQRRCRAERQTLGGGRPDEEPGPGEPR